MKRLLPSCLLLLASTAALAHEPATPSHDVVVVEKPTKAQLQQLGLRFGHVMINDKGNEARVEASAEDRAWLSSLGMRWQRDEEASAALHVSLQPLDILKAIPDYQCYRTVEETQDTIAQLVADYPNLASSIEIGNSWQRVQNQNTGYALHVLKLTNAEIDGDKPKMFVMSSMHAREYTPAELMTRYAESLLQGYGNDAESTWLLDNMEFHFLLQANPDGRKRAESGLSWRKNTNSTQCQGSSAGIDLNRNYPVYWDYPNGGSHTAPCRDTYRGLSAASEPETQAVIDYVSSIFPDTRPGNPEDVSAAADENTQGLFLDIHSYSKLVLWPWGHDTERTGNARALETLGMRMAWFNDYEPQQSVGLYATRGTTDDFAYGELGLPAYTLELGDAFFERCDAFENTILPDNLKVLRYASRILHAPYKLPAGPEAHSASLSETEVVQGESVSLSARIDDSRYRNPRRSARVTIQPGTRHAIAGARYYINTLPWADDAEGTDMQAADGSFNSTAENVQAQIDTSDLSPGRHLVYIQGHDVAGEYGPPTAVFLDILPAPEPQEPEIFEDGFEEEEEAPQHAPASRQARH